jgi:hypothetical protein
MAEKNCKLCFHYDVCYAVGRMLERAETCSKYAPDVVEVKHGNWIFYNDGSGTCSVCGRHQKHIWDMCSWQKYCGHCGAKMDGGKTE